MPGMSVSGRNYGERSVIEMGLQRPSFNFQGFLLVYALRNEFAGIFELVAFFIELPGLIPALDGE